MSSESSKGDRSKRSTRRGVKRSFRSSSEETTKQGGKRLSTVQQSTSDRPSPSTSQQSTSDRPSPSTSQQSTSDRPSLSTSQQSTSDRPSHSTSQQSISTSSKSYIDILV